MNALAEQLPYPQGVMRFAMRMPLILYRLGLGWLAGAAYLMALTTRGRKSGLARHTVVEFRRHGSKIYAVSAWADRPEWYKNIQQDPAVTLKIGNRAMSAQASTVDDPAEALRVLVLFRKTNPTVYDALLARLSNEKSIDLKSLPDIATRFTIVRFNPVSDAQTPPAIKSNLVWIWPLMLVTIFTGAIFARIARPGRT